MMQATVYYVTKSFDEKESLSELNSVACRLAINLTFKLVAKRFIRRKRYSIENTEYKGF